MSDDLTPCSDAHCILAEQPRRGMCTQGGCQHLKARGPEVTRLLRALAAEVRRLRSLPVIATCGECGWCHREPVRGGWTHICENPNAPEQDLVVESTSAPPDWCPLRKEAR